MGCLKNASRKKLKLMGEDGKVYDLIGHAAELRRQIGDKLEIRAHDSEGAVVPAHPTVLLVDDNRDLLHFLERLMADAGWTLLTAESATEAKRSSSSSGSSARG